MLFTHPLLVSVVSMALLHRGWAAPWPAAAAWLGGASRSQSSSLRPPPLGSLVRPLATPSSLLQIWRPGGRRWLWWIWPCGAPSTLLSCCGPQPCCHGCSNPLEPLVQIRRGRIWSPLESVSTAVRQVAGRPSGLGAVGRWVGAALRRAPAGWPGSGSHAGFRRLA